MAADQAEGLFRAAFAAPAVHPPLQALAATAALELLVCTAFGGAVRGQSAVVVGDGVDEVDEVVAEVAPTDLASTRVVSKAGFVRVGERLDPDQEHAIQWVRRLAA